MANYRLPSTVEERLQALARKTGRSMAALTREAVLEEIAVLEDYYRAAALARRQRARPDSRWRPLQ